MKLKKVVIFIALLLAALAAAVLCAFFWYRSASQPQINGSIRLSGLGTPIDIVHDAEGIPHIYAKSAGDAYFALGFVHAQDRLWQMEMNRRIPAGRMAEILGPNAVDADRFLRTLGVRRNAERILNNLSADTRAALESYARGVNAYLAN
ncbi:MAG TPA: penicillin acylase family protein, partial [Noviherbaspirillum sp.]